MLEAVNKDAYNGMDVFEGTKGWILRTGINTVVDMKLKSLK